MRAGEVIYDGPSSALTRSFLSSLYGDESAELFVPGFDRFGREDSQPSQKARIMDGASVFAVSNAFSILKSDDAALVGAP